MRTITTEPNPGQLSPTQRDAARATLRRFTDETLAPAELVERPEPCAHDDVEPRIRTLRNATRHYVWQCLVCGGHVRPVRRDETSDRMAAEQNAPFDEALAEVWNDQQTAQWQAWHTQRLEGHERKQSAWWTDTYEPYMASVAWREKRARRLEMDRHCCQAMLDGCTQRATDVHHLSYKHFGNEPLFELISICRCCHDQIHNMERRGRDAS